MVRIATVTDAEQLDILNDEFNGKGETTIEKIRESLAMLKIVHHKKNCRNVESVKNFLV